MPIPGGHRVVVTGVGVISPIGVGKEAFWNSLLAGRSGVRRIAFPNAEMDRYRTRIAAPVEGFDPQVFLPVDKRTKHFGRATLFALAGTRLALEDAGLGLSQDDGRMKIRGVNPYKVGVILGASAGNMEILEKELERSVPEDGPRRFSPYSLPHYLISSIPASVAILYDCRGINCAVSTSCTSASVAIGNAFRQIRYGQEDIIIAGGAEAGINPTVFGGFSALRAMSARNDDPRKASRPFDRERDGFVMGEGAGIVILEKLEHARERGAPIYAELKGYGLTADSYHLTAPDQEGRSFSEAIHMALGEAALHCGQIDYVNAHGTSTKLNDAIETRGLKLGLGKRAYEIPVNSTKSMTGHLLGAAGGVELIATLLSMRENTVHPTINLDHPDPECDLDYVPNEKRHVPIQAAMSSSLGFGGFNAVLVLDRCDR